QMEAYYTRLLQGGGRSEALRQVQLGMLHDPQHVHPYYWASFIVSGNPAALDGKPAPPDFLKVSPGMRGCNCEIGATSPANPGVSTALPALLAFPPLARRRPCKGPLPRQAPGPARVHPPRRVQLCA